MKSSKTYGSIFGYFLNPISNLDDYLKTGIFWGIELNFKILSLVLIIILFSPSISNFSGDSFSTNESIEIIEENVVNVDQVLVVKNYKNSLSEKISVNDQKNK